MAINLPVGNDLTVSVTLPCLWKFVHAQVCVFMLVSAAMSCDVAASETRFVCGFFLEQTPHNSLDLRTAAAKILHPRV